MKPIGVVSPHSNQTIRPYVSVRIQRTQKKTQKIAKTEKRHTSFYPKALAWYERRSTIDPDQCDHRHISRSAAIQTLLVCMACSRIGFCSELDLIRMVFGTFTKLGTDVEAMVWFDRTTHWKRLMICLFFFQA
jgi:hypothetical protein